MNELPPEMVQAVLQWVEAHDMLSVQLVCRLWHQVTKQDHQALWRNVYLSTWPPPLTSPSAAADAAAAVAAAAASQLAESQPPARGRGRKKPVAPKKKAIGWRALCLLRLYLDRHHGPERRLAQALQALPTDTAAALDELYQKRKRNHDDAVQPGGKKRQKTTKVTKKKKKPATSRRRRAAKNEDSESESENGDEEDDGPVFTRGFQASGWSEPKEIAQLREAISEADKILEMLSRIEYMRRNTQTLLSTISMRNARGRQVHRALSALSRCILYTNVNVDISLESDDMSETSVLVIIFSPATGLPLQIDLYHVHPIVNITWKHVGLVENHTWGSWSNQHHLQHDEGTSVDQMMRMLLGEHAEAVQRHDMALFLRAVFTARPEMELHQELDW